VFTYVSTRSDIVRHMTTPDQELATKLAQGLFGRGDHRAAVAQVRGFTGSRVPSDLNFRLDLGRLIGALYFQDAVYQGAVRDSTQPAAQPVSSGTGAALGRARAALERVVRDALRGRTVDLPAPGPGGAPCTLRLDALGDADHFFQTVNLAASQMAHAPAAGTAEASAGSTAAPTTDARGRPAREARLGPPEARPGDAFQLPEVILRQLDTRADPRPAQARSAVRPVVDGAITAAFRGRNDTLLAPLLELLSAALGTGGTDAGGTHATVTHMYRNGAGREARVTVYYAHMAWLAPTLGPDHLLGRAGSSGNAASAHVHMEVTAYVDGHVGKLHPYDFFGFAPD
jgi:hypothetical protein